MTRLPILGAPIDAVTPAEAVARVQEMLTGHDQHHVMTPNNEMLVYAHSHPEFLALLNRTSLNIPDSTGLVWAMRRRGATIHERVTGVDTVTALCAELGPESPVFFLGGWKNAAGEAATALLQKNPRLTVAGVAEGSPAEDDAFSLVTMINESGAKLLLVAYGAPKQDEWIDRHLKDMPGVRVAIGIGGTFDFLAGRIKRAPKFLRIIGLEWLWRLIQQPSRLPRIIKAVLVFPWLVLREKR